VIFISDGQEAPPAGSEERALFGDFKPGQIHGWLIGAGGDLPQPIPHTDPDGRRIGYWHADEVVQNDADPHSHEELSELRQPHLQAIARQVGFGYARLSDAKALSAAMRDGRSARRAPVTTRIDWLLAAVALLLLCWRFRPDAAPAPR
jgi:mxaL protein